MCGNQKKSQCLVSMVMHEITGSKEKVGTCFCFSCPLCLIGKDRTQNLYVVFESKCYTYLNVTRTSHTCPHCLRFSFTELTWHCSLRLFPTGNLPHSQVPQRTLGVGEPELTSLSAPSQVAICASCDKSLYAKIKSP